MGSSLFCIGETRKAYPLGCFSSVCDTLFGSAGIVDGAGAATVRATGMVVVVESNPRRETEKHSISALDGSSESPFQRHKLVVVRVPVWIHWQVSGAKGGPM